MKKINLLIPLAATVAGVIPAVAMTGCHKPVDTNTINTGDSYYVYSYKLPKCPTSGTTTVTISQKEGNVEMVHLYDKANAQWTDTLSDVPVERDGTVKVTVGYDKAPTQSASSGFNLKFDYDETNDVTNVNDLTFNYNVDYDVDLKDGEWQSKITPASAEHWTTGATVGEIYIKDVSENSAIFQSDARYSTSQNIKIAQAVGTIQNLKSLRAYFNDIYEDDNGLNVQMNYEIKSDIDGVFKFKKYHDDQKTTYDEYTFTDFDLTCNFITANGYKITWDSENKYFKLTDPTAQYDLTGRLKGHFHAIVVNEKGETQFAGQDVDYDGEIVFPESGTLSKESVAFMFAFGLIQQTYHFEWGSGTTELQILSHYAKNA